MDELLFNVCVFCLYIWEKHAQFLVDFVGEATGGFHWFENEIFVVVDFFFVLIYWHNSFGFFFFEMLIFVGVKICFFFFSFLLKWIRHKNLCSERLFKNFCFDWQIYLFVFFSVICFDLMKFIFLSFFFWGYKFSYGDKD